MMPLLRALGPRVACYAVDLPGYGRSADPPRRLGLDGMVAALASWMDTAGLPPSILVGNSIGAQVVVELGLAHPERMAAAVLVGATRDPASGGRIRHLWRLALDAPRERLSLAAVALVDYLRAGPRLMLGLFGEALRQPEESQLARLVAPTLVVRGDRDPISSRAWNREIAELLPAAHLVEIPGAAHAVNYSAPAPLAEAILAFAAVLR